MNCPNCGSTVEPMKHLGYDENILLTQCGSCYWCSPLFSNYNALKDYVEWVGELNKMMQSYREINEPTFY